MTKKSVHQKDTIVYVSHIGTPKYIEQVLTGLKGAMENKMFQ